MAKALGKFLLQHEYAQVGRDGVKPAREHDARAAGLRGGFVRVDHLAHPGGFATQVHIVHTAGGAGGHQFVAIQLVRAHGGQHQARGVHQRLQAGGVGGVGHHQGGVGWCAQLVAHSGQLVGIAPAHGPAQAAACGVALQQVFNDQAAGKAGGTVDDQIKRLVHAVQTPKSAGVAGVVPRVAAGPAGGWRIVWAGRAVVCRIRAGRWGPVFSALSLEKYRITVLFG